jgi:hypothetical protein
VSRPLSQMPGAGHARLAAACPTLMAVCVLLLGRQSVVLAIRAMSLEEQYVLWCLPAMGQAHVLELPAQGVPPAARSPVTLARNQYCTGTAQSCRHASCGHQLHSLGTGHQAFWQELAGGLVQAVTLATGLICLRCCQHQTASKLCPYFHLPWCPQAWMAHFLQRSASCAACCCGWSNSMIQWGGCWATSAAASASSLGVPQSCGRHALLCNARGALLNQQRQNR